MGHEVGKPNAVAELPGERLGRKDTGEEWGQLGSICESGPFHTLLMCFHGLLFTAARLHSHVYRDTESKAVCPARTAG